MADVNTSNPNLVEVENTEIPPGDEHNRCREALKNAGANINLPGERDLTPLSFAVTEDHPQCVNALMKAGADVNAADGENWIPLMFAVPGNHVHYVNKLIKAGTDVNTKNRQGDTALNLAAHWGREACLKLLVEVGADVNIPDDNRVTPLHNSIMGQFGFFYFSKLINGQYKFYEVGASEIGGQWENLPDMLIKAGANVNQGNCLGHTPLMSAVRNDLTRITNILLTAGADVNINDEYGHDALYHSAYNTNFDMIQILLTAGANVNRRDSEGESPLISAVRTTYLSLNHKLEQPERVKCVNVLIKAGADVNAETRYGETALTCTGLLGYVKCMKSLIEAGADVNHSAIKDGVPTVSAVSNIGHYMRFDRVMNEGDTTLIQASRYGHYKCIDLLLTAGADVNANNSDGFNALHITDNDLYFGNLSRCIKRLLRAGIHINKLSKSQGKNALGRILDFKLKYQNAADEKRVFMGVDTEVDSEAAMMLLYAAGETLEGTEEDRIPEVLKFEEEKLELKHICREAIRKHLLKLDLHSSLFGRIPKLGLPSALSRYLLFNLSLDEKEDDDDDNDDDDGDSWLKNVGKMAEFWSGIDQSQNH